MNEEISEQEAYQEILKKMHEKDDLIKTQANMIKNAKEVMEKYEKEKEATREVKAPAIGYCDECGKDLTREEAEAYACPHCGSKSYTPY